MAAGLLDANFDMLLGEGLSAGLSFTMQPTGQLLSALRGTYRLAGSETDGWAIGLTGSAGQGPQTNFDLSITAWSPNRGFYWLQPAAVGALYFFEQRLILRATVGPAFLFNQDLELMEGSIVPNVELAYRLTPMHEVTLGGNALVGLRMFLPRRTRSTGLR